jgi:hypothetical protein
MKKKSQSMAIQDKSLDFSPRDSNDFGSAINDFEFSNMNDKDLFSLI